MYIQRNDNKIASHITIVKSKNLIFKRNKSIQMKKKEKKNSCETL